MAQVKRLYILLGLYDYTKIDIFVETYTHANIPRKIVLRENNLVLGWVNILKLHIKTLRPSSSIKYIIRFRSVEKCGKCGYNILT